MDLSPHFSLSEMTRNGAGLGNTPGATELANLRHLCASVLEPLRAHFGPVSIHSGYRGPEVNAATHGASKTSQHMRGEAADLHAPGHTCEEVIAWLRSSGLPVDQVIGETRNGHPPFTWVHVSSRADGKNRGEFLQTYDGAHYAPLTAV